jgi:hypothetical protein
MAETRKIAAILAADVVGFSRMASAGGRLHFGMVAGFKPESVAGLRRNSHTYK